MIASSDDVKVQKALTTAYEQKKLRGKALLQVRKVIEKKKNSW